LFQTLFDEQRQEMWREEEEDIDDDRLLANIMLPDFHYSAPKLVEEEEEDTVLLSCGKILRLVTSSKTYDGSSLQRIRPSLARM